MPDLDAVLSGLPALAGSRVQRRLSGGYSSDSWLLDGPIGPCVLRLDLPAARRLGLDRQAEWRILEVAHTAGLGPRPIFHDPDLGVLVTAFVQGPVWTAQVLQQPDHLAILGRLLRRVHEQPAPGAVFDPGRVAERYARAAGAPGLAPAVARAERLGAMLYDTDQHCLCHHDPHAGNLVGRAPLMLVDWEYAARGQGLFDLAVVTRFHGLSPARRDLLLEAWAGRVDPEMRERLDDFCALYELLAGLWERAINSG